MGYGRPIGLIGKETFLTLSHTSKKQNNLDHLSFGEKSYREVEQTWIFFFDCLFRLDHHLILVDLFQLFQFIGQP